jgi:hypothetical protein
MKKTDLILGVAIITVIATIGKAILNEFMTSKPSPDAVSYSIAESEKDNVLVQVLAIEPRVIQTDSGLRPIKSAWIEKNSDHTFRLVWFHYRKEKSGYKLVVKPAEGNPVWRLLAMPEGGSSFTNIGGGFLFHETIDSVPDWPLEIEIKKSWKEPTIQTLTLTPKT